MEKTPKKIHNLSNNMLRCILEFFYLSEYKNLMMVNKKLTFIVSEKYKEILPILSKYVAYLLKNKFFVDVYSHVDLEDLIKNSKNESNGNDLFAEKKIDASIILHHILTEVLKMKQQIIYSGKNKPHDLITKYFFTALTCRNSIKRLIFYDPMIDYTFLEKLFKKLKSGYCKNIYFLDLSGCNFTAKEAELISIFLTETSFIKTLYLRKSLIDEKGVSLIANSLKLNTCLEVLNMANCTITSNNLVDLFEALKINNTLKHLNLDGTVFIADIFSDFISSNQTLEHLSLDDCKINDLDLKIFSQAVIKNKSLRELSLYSNFLTKNNSFNNIKKIIQESKSLNKLYIALEYDFDMHINKFKNISENDSNYLNSIKSDVKVFLSPSKQTINGDNKQTVINYINYNNADSVSVDRWKCLIF